MQFRFIPKKHIPMALGILALVLFFRFVLPYIMPIALGLLCALGLSPLIARIQKRFGMSRSLAALLTIAGILLLMALILFLSGKFLIAEAERLSSLLPELVLALSGYVSSFVSWVESLAGLLPQGAYDAFSSWADTLLQSGGTLASGIYEKLFSMVSGFLGDLPDHLLFLFTFVLSCYFASAELPRLRELLALRLPPEQLARWRQLSSSGKAVIAGWLRAQIKLMGVTFLVLLTGFFLLRIEFPFLFALGIALLDALPLLGTGIILLPWGLLSMISGDLKKGIGLIILYGIAALLRNVLEPKLLGDQVGISPLFSLLAIYGGYRLSGFWGMVLLPLMVMVAAEIFSTGRLRQGQEP